MLGVGVEDICEGEVQSKGLEEMHGFLFWLSGRTVDICPRGLSDRLSLTAKLVLAFVLKSVFRQVRKSLNVSTCSKVNLPVFN